MAVPWGSIHVRQKLGRRDEYECSVYVDGNEIARLPVSRVVWTADESDGGAALAKLELTTLVQRAAIDTLEIDG